MMNRINEPVITSEIVTDMEAGIAFENMMRILKSLGKK